MGWFIAETDVFSIVGAAFGIAAVEGFKEIRGTEGESHASDNF
jgi:hypothetical protein